MGGWVVGWLGGWMETEKVLLWCLPVFLNTFGFAKAQPCPAPDGAVVVGADRAHHRRALLSPVGQGPVIAT